MLDKHNACWAASGEQHWKVVKRARILGALPSEGSSSGLHQDYFHHKVNPFVLLSI
jgi:hypothetical protein